MSSILKALKKLEEEQAARSNAASPRSGGQYVAVDRKRRRPVLLVGCIVVAILLVGVLFQALRDIRELPVARPPLPSTAVSPPKVAVASVPPVVTALQSAQPTSAQIEQRTPASDPAQDKTIPVDNRPVAAAPPAVSAEPVHEVDVERREIPLPGQQWSAPQLKVDDILPAAGGEPMAIVNGLPVMEGTLVENALVEKIHPDRVRFIIDGKVVEIRPSPSP